MHSTSRHPLVCTGEEASKNTVTLLCSLDVSDTFCYSLETWQCMISSTKHTTVIYKLGHSEKCMYMKDVLCYNNECII